MYLIKYFILKFDFFDSHNFRVSSELEQEGCVSQIASDSSAHCF